MGYEGCESGLGACGRCGEGICVYAFMLVCSCVRTRLWVSVCQTYFTSEHGLDFFFAA